MLEPIKKVEDINPELIYKMTRDCMNSEWIKDFYTSDKEEIYTMMINENKVIIIKALLLSELHYTDIAKKVSEFMRTRQKLCFNLSDIHLKVQSGLIMDYNYCKNAYYDLINSIYQKIIEIVKGIETKKMKINYDYIGNPEKIIALENRNHSNNNYLPGVSTRDFNSFLESEIQMSNYFRKYIVSVIDKNGQLINVEREKITKKEDPINKKVEFLYDGKVIQEKGEKNFLLHGGLRNALIIELEKACKRKRNGV